MTWSEGGGTPPGGSGLGSALAAESQAKHDAAERAQQKRVETLDITLAERARQIAVEASGRAAKQREEIDRANATGWKLLKYKTGDWMGGVLKKIF